MTPGAPAPAPGTHGVCRACLGAGHGDEGGDCVACDGRGWGLRTCPHGRDTAEGCMHCGLAPLDPAPTSVGPRGKVGEVTVVDIGGDGTGPWRLFIGEYGVADWPCTHDPRAYALVVAKSTRSALRIWGRERPSHTEQDSHDPDYARGRQMGHAEGFAEGQASMTVRGQEQQLDEARRVIASLRAELEDVKVDRDSADQALDRERARTPKTFSELQAQSLQGTVPQR